MERAAGTAREASLIDDDRLFPPDAATRAVARRLYQSVKVVEHQLGEDEAYEVAHALAYGLAKKAYKL